MRAYRIVASLIVLAAPLSAQTGNPTTVEETLIQRITAALELPRLTAAIRETGVPDTTVRSLLNSMDRWRLPNTEQVAILTAERDAARANGPTNNFGAFVQGRLAAGLRGRQLAAAIRAEHLRQGNGPTYKERPDSARGNPGRGFEHKEDVGRPKPTPN